MEDDTTLGSATVVAMNEDGTCAKHPHVLLRSKGDDGMVYQQESCPACDEEFLKERMSLKQKKAELDRQLQQLDENSASDVNSMGGMSGMNGGNMPSFGSGPRPPPNPYGGATSITPVTGNGGHNRYGSSSHHQHHLQGPMDDHGYTRAVTTDMLTQQLLRMQQMQDWMYEQKEREIATLRAKVEEQQELLVKKEVEIALLKEKLSNQQQQMQQELKMIKLAAMGRAKGDAGSSRSGGGGGGNGSGSGRPSREIHIQELHVSVQAGGEGGQTVDPQKVKAATAAATTAAIASAEDMVQSATNDSATSESDNAKKQIDVIHVEVDSSTQEASASLVVKEDKKANPDGPHSHGGETNARDKGRDNVAITAKEDLHASTRVAPKEEIDKPPGKPVVVKEEKRKQDKNPAVAEPAETPSPTKNSDSGGVGGTAIAAAAVGAGTAAAAGASGEESSSGPEVQSYSSSANITVPTNNASRPEHKTEGVVPSTKKFAATEEEPTAKSQRSVGVGAEVSTNGSKSTPSQAADARQNGVEEEEEEEETEKSDLSEARDQFDASAINPSPWASSEGKTPPSRKAAPSASSANIAKQGPLTKANEPPLVNPNENRKTPMHASTSSIQPRDHRAEDNSDVIKQMDYDLGRYDSDEEELDKELEEVNKKAIRESQEKDEITYDADAPPPPLVADKGGGAKAPSGVPKRSMDEPRASIPRELDIDNTGPPLIPSQEEITVATMENNKSGSQFHDDSKSVGQTVASSTYGEDRQKVNNQTLLDPYGDRGVYSGIVLRSTGMPHGLGRMVYEDDGRTYEGDWRHGRWHGYGRATFANGDTYEGEYRFDQRHGRGVYSWNDGRVYDGAFSEDKRHGTGTFKWPDGATYEGDFVQGQREGHGRYTFSDGGYYVGSWVDGRYEGYGVCHWEDGRTYKGEWRAGMAHGNGVETYPDGRVRHDGQWQNDEPIRG